MRKIFAFLVAFLSLFVVACSDTSVTNNDSNASLSLRVGTAPNYKPFDYKEDAKLTGLDIDLVNEIAKREGIELTWVEMSFDGLIPALKTGKIDMIASAMSATEDRRKSVDFSDVYYTTKNLYIKKKDNEVLNSKEDLEGKIIGVQLGTLQEPAAKAIKDTKVQSNESLSVVIMELKEGKIDAVVADKDVSTGYLKENADLIGFFEEEDGSEGFSFAFDKDKQKEAIEKFNKGLKDLKADGTYDQILTKYELN
ncbi:basic amino acid ABC transporter substrate-binding protein [Campylobacter upsaliensis]|uniref:basic amino acid ABC transporter substrate-binding protein n=1 Tax=Campylobacter upsaliensis TaxID=28080 RepID=UPI00004B3233|nr:basic amino acid ABC transporter substrate-binding protein [Campylobacter upsaliensis]EAL52859.1 glutamine ABC transporter, periplasmic glutamine-binding protein [Campylobacter upsaliensis RM3195]MCR2114139.1 basic amino acid ABC transporter substrate-binding protein [Campylobacter upsaliensis]MCR2115051.1 basic amino acid ABC transporter substrate-binding protein [Campylobacter upsaliensis]MCR2123092.1 basic amino acid ABC transporter substrate-binding protein [Campylobacter upsaliensis]MC